MTQDGFLRKRRRQAPFNTFETATPCAQLSPTLWEVERHSDLAGITYVCSEMDRSVCPSLGGALVGIEWASSGAPDVDCIYDPSRLTGNDVRAEYMAVWGEDEDAKRLGFVSSSPAPTRLSATAPQDELHYALASHPALRGFDSKQWCRPHCALDPAIRKQLARAANDLANLSDNPRAFLRRVRSLTGCALTFYPLSEFRKRILARNLPLMQPQHMSGTETTLEEDSRSTSTSSYDEDTAPVVFRREQIRSPQSQQLQNRRWGSKPLKLRQGEDCKANKIPVWAIVLIIILILVILGLTFYYFYYPSTVGVVPGAVAGARTTRTFYQ